MNNIFNIETNNECCTFATQFLPSIAWLSFAAKQKQITIDIYEHFIKQTYRNRATILCSQGLINIIVPIARSQKKIIIKDAVISYKEKWDIEAWRTIFSCYGKSPYFIYYADKLQKIILSKQKYLIDLNFLCFEFIKKSMKLDIDVFVTNQYIEREDNNYKNLFLPKQREEQFTSFGTYTQCFEDKFGFVKNLSSLDLLMNLGPQSKDYLKV